MACRRPGRVLAGTGPRPVSGRTDSPAAALDTAAGEIEISGDAGELRWTTSVSLADANPGTGIGSLWRARRSTLSWTA